MKNLSNTAEAFSPTVEGEALAELLAMLRRSFLQYLPYASPYIPANHKSTPRVLAEVAADQRRLADRVASRLDSMGINPETGSFPMEFTDSHDLSIDYLLTRAINYQQQDIAKLQTLSASLALHPRTKSLVDEAVGMASGHLDCMQECMP